MPLVRDSPVAGTPNGASLYSATAPARPCRFFEVPDAVQPGRGRGEPGDDSGPRCQAPSVARNSSTNRASAASAAATAAPLVTRPSSRPKNHERANSSGKTSERAWEGRCWNPAPDLSRRPSHHGRRSRGCEDAARTNLSNCDLFCLRMSFSGKGVHRSMGFLSHRAGPMLRARGPLPAVREVVQYDGRLRP